MHTVTLKPLLEKCHNHHHRHHYHVKLTWTPTAPPCPTGQRHSQLAGLHLQFFPRHGLYAENRKQANMKCSCLAWLCKWTADICK